MAENEWMAQAQSVLNAWTEAQQSLWRSWADLVNPAASGPYSSSLVEQWQKLVQHNVETIMAGAAPVAQNTADQFLVAQSVVLRFLEFSARAWQATAPKFEKGEDWEASLKQAVEGLRQEWLQYPADVAGTARDTEKLRQLYWEQWKNFGQPWQAVFQQMPGSLAQAAMGRGTAMVDLSNQFREAYNQTFGPLASSPNLGLARELNQKISRGFDAWMAQYLANLEYQGVLAQIWDQAFQAFSDNLVAAAEQNKKIDNVTDLILLWTRGAEQVFSNAFRTEKYVMAQGKYLSASMTYRKSEREIIEVFLKMYDLPTRSELDQAHRRIYELRKEVKALKKAMARMTPASS